MLRECYLNGKQLGKDLNEGAHRGVEFPPFHKGAEVPPSHLNVFDEHWKARLISAPGLADFVFALTHHLPNVTVPIVNQLFYCAIAIF